MYFVRNASKRTGRRPWRAHDWPAWSGTRRRFSCALAISSGRVTLQGHLERDFLAILREGASTRRPKPTMTKSARVRNAASSASNRPGCRPEWPTRPARPPAKRRASVMRAGDARRRGEHVEVRGELTYGSGPCRVCRRQRLRRLRREESTRIAGIRSPNCFRRRGAGRRSGPVPRPSGQHETCGERDVAARERRFAHVERNPTSPFAGSKRTSHLGRRDQRTRRGRPACRSIRAPLRKPSAPSAEGPGGTRRPARRQRAGPCRPPTIWKPTSRHPVDRRRCGNRRSYPLPRKRAGQTRWLRGQISPMNTVTHGVDPCNPLALLRHRSPMSG